MNAAEIAALGFLALAALVVIIMAVQGLSVINLFG